MESGNSAGNEEDIRLRISHPREITGPASATNKIRARIYQDLKDEARNQTRIAQKLTRLYAIDGCLSSRER